jgi:cell division protease FtsH
MQKLFFSFYYIWLIPSMIQSFNIRQATNIYNNRYYFDEIDSTKLVDKIHSKSIQEIIISPKKEEVISIENTNSDNNVFDLEDQDSDRSLLSYKGLDLYHKTKVNDFILRKVINDGLDSGAHTTFLEVPPVSFENGLQMVVGFINIGLPLLVLFLSLRSFIGFLGFMSGNNPGPNGRRNFPGMNLDRILGGNTEINTFNATKFNISLASWSGSPEVFYECYEIVSFLKNETAYKNAGAEIPKGILLEGPPGTGKTLLAKAIAAETNANFIAASGSQFVEMFVGVGAQRVRQIFDNARKNRPCIIFIDEIDAIGKKRNTGSMINTNDERESTLNELLAQMDGFTDNEGIIVIGATNLKSLLDDALIRPGRFDRIVSVPYPDKESRAAILQQYLSKKKIQSNITVNDLAEFTSGYSGAQLKNLVNEATIFAVRRGATEISVEDIERSLEKSLIGITRQKDSRSYPTKLRVALHEIGHATMAVHFSDSFILNKVSIQDSYSGVGGYTLFIPNPRNITDQLYTKDYLYKQIMVSLGGKACEEVFYGDQLVSLGATRDLEQANNLAKNMIEQFGMGKEWKVFFRNRNSGFLNDISEETQSSIEKEAYEIVYMAYNETLQVIRQNQARISTIADYLILKKNLSGERFIKLFSNQTHFL